MNKLKMGFAGFRHGHIFGLYQAAESNADVEIAAVWEENEAARMAAMERSVCFDCTTYDEMLSRSDIDIIAIGDYYGRRGELAIKALKAGKHIIADKPLCTSLDELYEIRRLAQEKNLKVGMMLDLRYNKNILMAKKLVDDGEIGEINNISFGGQHCLAYGERPAWYFEDGKHGGTINDISIHAMDVVKNYLALDVQDICAARVWNKMADQEPQFKESAQFMLKLSNGAGLLADVSYMAPSGMDCVLPYYWSFQIWGTKGMLAFTISSDKVELYQKNQKDVLLFDGIETDRNWLTDFLDDIAEKSHFTAGILASTEETLKIQAAADR